MVSGSENTGEPTLERALDLLQDMELSSQKNEKDGQHREHVEETLFGVFVNPTRGQCQRTETDKRRICVKTGFCLRRCEFFMLILSFPTRLRESWHILTKTAG